MATDTPPRAFVVHPQDNVATLLSDAPAAAPVTLHGEADVDHVVAAQDIALGHKLALRDIRADEPIVKFGVTIGRATQAITPGQWVHLHNCASELDERSSTLDVHTGQTTDTRYE